MKLSRTLFGALAASFFAVSVGQASSVTGYIAQGTRSSIHNILFQNNYEDSWSAGVGYNQTLTEVPCIDGLTLEAEGVFMKHVGKQHHEEFAAAPLLRYAEFPWNDVVKTTAAIGLGVSYATDLPQIEQEKNEKSNTLLVFLPVEVTVAPPSAENWELAFRIHHRSGAWGVVGPKGGSNFAAIGVRYHF